MGAFYKYKGNVDINSEEGRKLLDRDLNSILNQEMWFANLDSLNDKNEGIHSLKRFEVNLYKTTKGMDLLHLKKHDDEVNQNLILAVKNVIEIHKKITGIFSLTTDYSNALMWSHYANSHKGYCIEYEFEGLENLKLKHFESNQLRNFDSLEKVKYSNKVITLSNINLSPNDFKKIVTQKTLEWAYEKEFRILVNVWGSYNHNPNVIKSIIFGLSTSEIVRDYIINKLEDKGIEFFQMRREKHDSVRLIKHKINI